MFKIYDHKIWQISLTGEPEEIYGNVAKILSDMMHGLIGWSLIYLC
jgi:hypothetical protein